MMLPRDKPACAAICYGITPALGCHDTDARSFGDKRQTSQGCNDGGGRIALFDKWCSHEPNNTEIAFLVKQRMRSSYFGEKLA